MGLMIDEIADVGPFNIEGHSYILQREEAQRGGVCQPCGEVFKSGAEIYFLKGTGPLIRNPNGFERLHIPCGDAYYEWRDVEEEETFPITRCWVEVVDSTAIRKSYVVRDDHGVLWTVPDRRRADGAADAFNDLMGNPAFKLHRVAQD